MGALCTLRCDECTYLHRCDMWYVDACVTPCHRFAQNLADGHWKLEMYRPAALLYDAEVRAREEKGIAVTAKTWYRLGQCHRRAGNMAGAAAAYTKCLQLTYDPVGIGSSRGAPVCCVNQSRLSG